MPLSPQITITPEDIVFKSLNISAVTYTSSTATYTATGHTFSAGNIVQITGLAPDGYNGTYTISSVATNTFTVANTTNTALTDQTGNAYWADPTEYEYTGGQTVAYLPNDDDISDIIAGDPVVSSKIQTYYALTPPLPPLNVGDLWFDTDDNNKQYRWDGTNWVSVQDGTIATKNRTYYSGTAPTGTFTVGDIWFDTSTGNKPYRWSGSSWISVQDASIATALSTANAAQTSANGKNKIIYSTSAASGSGTTVGDVWWQYNGSGQIIGQWEWNGSSWIPKTIGSQVIANLDAGKITAGTISVAISLEAATITGGSININSGTFVVTSAGAVTITAGSFNINSGTFQVSNTGSITATSGTIAGWTLSSTSFTNPGADTFLVANPGSDGIAYSTIGRGIMRRLQLNGSSGTTLGTNVLAVGGNAAVDGSLAVVSNTTVSGYIYNPGYQVSTSGGAARINDATTPTARLVAASGSSIRFKKDIVDISTVSALDPKLLLQVPVKAFKYREDYLDAEDERSDVLVPGFIAEELDAIYPVAVDHDAQGRASRWSSDFVVPGLLALIQDQEARIKALEAK